VSAGALPPRAAAAAAEAHGRWGEAAHLFAGRCREALAAGDLPGALDALRGQARVRNQQGRYEEAEELAELALEVAERSGLAGAAARALNVLGMVLHARGSWDEARRIFPRAIEAAIELGDDELAGLACLNAGVMASLMGEEREARLLYLESIGSFVRSENSEQVMLAYNNLGLLSAGSREWMEAELYFARGIEIGERLSRAPLLAKLYCNRAEPLIRVGEYARALESLERAERLASSVGDRAITVEVHRFRGMLERARGRPGDAEAHLRSALLASEAPALAPGRAEVLRELGLLRLDGGDGAAARGYLEEAREAFLRLGARREAAEISGLLSAGAAPPDAPARRLPSPA
jgi:tetratricopeptide (TPR) repeat protein